MNRKERRKKNKSERQEAAARIKELPSSLTRIPRSEWPYTPRPPVAAWQSKDYIVQAYQEPNHIIRLSVCRTSRKKSGGWADKITWDELQQVKREVGFGNEYAVEVYPPDDWTVNVANMRHLWILPEPIPHVGWMR